VPAAQDEVFSYSYDQSAQEAPPPEPAPAPEPPRMTPPPKPVEQPKETPALGSPPVTLAASELFARLRREVAAAREQEARESQGTATPSLPANSTS
jgi:hypothetical protein